MGNIISNEKINDQRILMSNGLTSVFIETICLAGSDHASEPYQKDIMIWFAQCDWQLLGMGLEGFDITEMMWDNEIFMAQQKFIFEVIDRAIQKTNWNLLGYDPHETIFTTLSDFRQMIQNFKSEFIDQEEARPIFEFDNDVQKYERCLKHKIYKHCMGCVMCNNEPVNSTP